MRRREFLRAVVGAVTGLAVGVPVLPRPRLQPLTRGLFDQVTTWNRRLTAAEVVELYNANEGIGDFTFCWTLTGNTMTDEVLVGRNFAKR